MIDNAAFLRCLKSRLRSRTMSPWFEMQRVMSVSMTVSLAIDATISAMLVERQSDNLGSNGSGS